MRKNNNNLSKEVDNKLRLDKYLWSIRLFKSRSLAAEACTENKVKQSGVALKASKVVQIGEEYEVKLPGKLLNIKVTGLLYSRKQYSEAINYYEILREETEEEGIKRMSSSFYTGKRPSKIGRPTKKERRDLDDLLDNM